MSSYNNNNVIVLFSVFPFIINLYKLSLAHFKAVPCTVFLKLLFPEAIDLLLNCLKSVSTLGPMTTGESLIP